MFANLTGAAPPPAAAAPAQSAATAVAAAAEATEAAAVAIAAEAAAAPAGVPAMFAGLPGAAPAGPPAAAAPVVHADQATLEAMQAAQGAKGINPPGDFPPPATDEATLETVRTTADAPNVSNPPRVAEPQVDAAPAAEKSKRKRKTKGAGFVVAYNALPSIAGKGFGEVVHLGDLLAPLLEHIAKEHRCELHPEGVVHWNLIEYGKGKSMLAHHFAKYLDKHAFNGVLVVDGNTSEGIAVKEVLMRRADLFIQGTWSQ